MVRPLQDHGSSLFQSGSPFQKRPEHPERETGQSRRHHPQRIIIPIRSQGVPIPEVLLTRKGLWIHRRKNRGADHPMDHQESAPCHQLSQFRVRTRNFDPEQQNRRRFLRGRRKFRIQHIQKLGLISRRRRFRARPWLRIKKPLQPNWPFSRFQIIRWQKSRFWRKLRSRSLENFRLK